MQKLTNRAVKIDRSPMTFGERVYLPAVGQGAQHHAGPYIQENRRPRSYPEEKRPFSPVFRGLHILNRDEQGAERCTACGLLCSRLPGRGNNDGGSRTETWGRASVPRREVCGKIRDQYACSCIFCGYLRKRPA